MSAPYTPKFFKPSEFVCKDGCGGGIKDMDEGFLRALDALREGVDAPIVLTSSYRCPKHNKAVSSTGPTGPHTTGRAADIHAQGDLAFDIVKCALELGFKRIGIGQRGMTRMVHVDLCDGPGYPSPRIWTY